MDHFDRQFFTASEIVNTPLPPIVEEDIVRDLKITDENELEAVRQAVKEFRNELARKRKERQRGGNKLSASQEKAP
jgi:hypothetical protein